MDNRCVAVPVCYGLSGSHGVRGHLRCEIVEGHRYADDQPSWYSGSQYARATEPDPTGNPYDSGIHERPSGAFRLPEQRPADPYALADPLGTTGSHARPAEPELSAGYEAMRIPVRGPEYPTIQPSPSPAIPEEPAPPVAAVAEPTSLVPQARPKDKVYQSRRPISAIVVAIVMVVLMIPVVRLLIDQTFTGDPTPAGIVPAVLLTLGFTLTAVGLYAIVRGGPIGRESWLRPPVAYLPMGLILLLAAGLAVA